MEHIRKSLTKYWKKQNASYLIISISVALIFTASFSFAISPQSPLFKNQLKQKILISDQLPEIKNDVRKTIKSPPTPTQKNNSSKNIIGITSISSPTPQPTTPLDINSPTIEQTASQQHDQPTNEESDNPLPSPTAAPSQIPTPTATPVVIASIVSVEIKISDSSSSFPVEIKEGMDVCDVLQKAKDEGKINSLTFDDSYLSTLNSRYVYEINGYKNNWTFTINGASPLGCSLSNPKPNDIIVWKFL